MRTRTLAAAAAAPARRTRPACPSSTRSTSVCWTPACRAGTPGRTSSSRSSPSACSSRSSSSACEDSSSADCSSPSPSGVRVGRRRRRRQRIGGIHSRGRARPDTDSDSRSDHGSPLFYAPSTDLSYSGTSSRFV